MIMGEDELYGTDVYEYYERLAERERQRQWNIAKNYAQVPSIPRLIQAAIAAWNSLPINTNSSTVNPNMNAGTVPTPNSIGGAASAAQKAFKAAKLFQSRGAVANSAAEEINPALRVRNLYDNYVSNPAEKAAAMDYIEELKQTQKYDEFLKNNPGYRIKTKIEPGVSEDWAYPRQTMIEHGLRKPAGRPANPNPATPVEQKPITPRKTSKQRSAEYYREKVEDRAQGVYKRQRKEFNAQKALATGDMRSVNPGRPSVRMLRDAESHIANYSRSAQKDYDKIRLRLAKRGYRTEEMVHHPTLKEFLIKLIQDEGHRW